MPVIQSSGREVIKYAQAIESGPQFTKLPDKSNLDDFMALEMSGRSEAVNSFSPEAWAMALDNWSEDPAVLAAFADKLPVDDPLLTPKSFDLLSRALDKPDLPVYLKVRTAISALRIENEKLRGR
jgi:hypothetical protein